MRKVTLSKKTGWIIFTLLLFVDAFLDVVRGAEGNPLWKPLVARMGINFVPFLVPLILPFFYLLVKMLGWLIHKTDKLPQAEELVLTTLVVVYFVYDLWVTTVDFLGFRLLRDFRQTIPFLIIAAFAYALSAERQLKRK